MTDDELMEIARPFAADGGRWPSDWVNALQATVKACVKTCEAAKDTGNDNGIERDVYVWNKAVEYCINRLRLKNQTPPKAPLAPEECSGSVPRPELLALAERCGAILTGKPDGSEAITIVFTVPAWRAFDEATLSPNVARSITDICAFPEVCPDHAHLVYGKHISKE